MRCQKQVQGIAYHSRLYSHPTVGHIQRKNLVEMTARIDNDPAPHDLPGQRCAGRARNQPNGLPSIALSGGKPNDFKDVVLRLRHRDGQRTLLILRSVGRIDGQRKFVVQQCALESTSERCKHLRNASSVRHGCCGKCHTPSFCRRLDLCKPSQENQPEGDRNRRAPCRSLA